MRVKQKTGTKITRISAYSKLPEILAKQKFSVSELYQRLSAKGERFDKKTLYRLASPKPLNLISAPILKAVCDELNVEIGDVLGWEPPRLERHKIDQKKQERLSYLMAKNNEDALTPAERAEFERLGAEAERLSRENARMLASVAGAAEPPRNKRPSKKSTFPPA